MKLTEITVLCMGFVTVVLWRCTSTLKVCWGCSALMVMGWVGGSGWSPCQYVMLFTWAKQCLSTQGEFFCGKVTLGWTSILFMGEFLSLHVLDTGDKCWLDGCSCSEVWQHFCGKALTCKDSHNSEGRAC